MEALTLRIPVMPARKSADVSTSGDGRLSSTGSVASPLCYKCAKPLPITKWPWKRCLDCRLEAERHARGTPGVRGSHNVPGPSRSRIPHETSTQSRLTCSICARSVVKSRSHLPLSVTSIPMCAPCHKTFLKSSSPGAVRLVPRAKRSKAKSGLHSTAPPPNATKPLLSMNNTTSETHPVHRIPATIGTGRPPPNADARPVSSSLLLDRIINQLARTKHFNERGEYILPQFVPTLAKLEGSILSSQHRFDYMPFDRNISDDIHRPPKPLPQIQEVNPPVKPDAEVKMPATSPDVSSNPPPDQETSKPLLPPLLNVLDAGQDKYATRSVDVAVKIIESDVAQDFSVSIPPSSTLQLPFSTPSISDEPAALPGWDSDLSELTSSDSGENLSEPDSDEDIPLKTPLRIVLPPIVPQTRRKPGHICQKSACKNLLIRNAKWKMCFDCRVKTRQYERARRGWNHRWLKGDCKEEDEWETNANKLFTLPDGRRKCTIRSCTEIIPAMEVYRWKMCEACRDRTRRRAQERKHGANVSSDQEEDEDEDVPLAKQLQLKREIQNLKSLKLTFKGRTVANVDTRAPAAVLSPAPSQSSSKLNVLSRSMFVHDNVQRTKLYQSSHTLLSDFRELLAAYIKAHDMYVLLKLASGANLERSPPSLFMFEGEFSVVSNPAGGDVGSKIQEMQANIAQSIGIRLVQIGVNVDPSGKVTGAFSCIHETTVNVPSGILTTSHLAQANDPTPTSLYRKLSGELYISLSWDRSHAHFAGMRTVVDFRLVG